MNNGTHQAVLTRFTEAKGTSLVREVFTSNFWMSGLAMLKYIPRSFGVKQVDGMAFFTESKHDEFRNRVLRITLANPRQWGTMNVSQMLHHLNLACGSALGFYRLPDESYLVSRTLFRWILVDWFPEQPVGLRLPKVSRFPTARNSTSTLKSSSCSKSWMLPGMQDHPTIGDRTPCSEK
jgi:hypothetical protein